MIAQLAGRSGVRILANIREFLLLQSVQTDIGVRRASYLMIKVKVHPYTGTDALYRPYGP
jgi:hypothetical protein